MNDTSSDSMTPCEAGQQTQNVQPSPEAAPSDTGILGRLNPFRKKSNGDSVRDTLEELLEEREEQQEPLDPQEAILLKNILGLRERTVEDVSVPRSDICAISVESTLPEVISQMTKEGHSRLPVFGEDLDDPVGMVHIKDVLAYIGKEQSFNLAKVCRQLLYVAPSARVPELLLEMRTKRVHMALVIDEYGGTDGLLTIEDLVEEIVGEIEDEHDRPEGPPYVERSDGTLEVDARMELDDFEELVGEFVTEEEREDVDTLGGLVFSLAGHVPVRGELVIHPDSGLEFQVEDADPRRIRTVSVRKLEGLLNRSSAQSA